MVEYKIGDLEAAHLYKCLRKKHIINNLSFGCYISLELKELEELKELKELKPNVMLVSEYRLLTPERSDNSL